jgi:hypothetical protein
MKCFYKYILSGLLTPWIVLAQIDTTLKKYFPMEIGNVWEYEEQGYPDLGHYQIKVVGDTTMPNGRVYRIFKGSSEPDYYRMDDSLNIYRYRESGSCLNNDEYIRFKLTAMDSSYWFYCTAPDTQYVKLITTRTDYYSYLENYFETKYYNEGTIGGWDNMAIRLAKGLGKTFSILEGPQQVLVGAVINGQTIGNVTSANQVERNLEKIREDDIRNYPNPFNSTTTIEYNLARSGFVSLGVYDIVGREVATLVNEYKPEGQHAVQFNATNLSNGIYLYCFQSGNIVQTKKLTVMK